jgi:hypothetical protein
MNQAGRNDENGKPPGKLLARQARCHTPREELGGTPKLTRHPQARNLHAATEPTLPHTPFGECCPRHDAAQPPAANLASLSGRAPPHLLYRRPMRSLWRVGLRFAARCAALGVWLVVAGCADGPIPELKHLNPWVRKQWAEDEAQVVTFHRKVADLADLRRKAASMPAAEQEATSAHLAARLQEERSPVLRAELVRTLAEFPTPAAYAAVLASLQDASPHVRAAACRGLARHPSQGGFEALAKTLTSDSDLDVRIAAATALGSFRGFEAARALRAALDDRDPALQLAAVSSLERLEGHPEYRRNVAVWREHLDNGHAAPPPPPSLAERLRYYWSWF